MDVFKLKIEVDSKPVLNAAKANDILISSVKRTQKNVDAYAKSFNALNRQRSTATIAEYRRQERELQKEINTSSRAVEKAHKSLTSYTRSVKTVEGAVDRYKNQVADLKRNYQLLAQVEGHTKKNLDAYVNSVKAARIEKQNSIAKINAFNQVLGQTGDKSRLARHNMVNLGYQLQDVVVGFASGQAPMTVFIQQGSQIAGIAASAGMGFKDMARNIIDMIKGVTIATARLLLLNPLILALTVAIASAVVSIKAMQKSFTSDLGIEKVRNDIRALGGDLDTFDSKLEELKGNVVTFGDVFRGVFSTLFNVEDITQNISDGFAWIGEKTKQSLIGLVALFKAGKARLDAALSGASFDEMNLRTMQAGYEAINEVQEKMLERAREAVDEAQRAANIKVNISRWDALQGVLTSMLSPVEKINKEWRDATEKVALYYSSLGSLTEEQSTEKENILLKLRVYYQKQITEEMEKQAKTKGADYSEEFTKILNTVNEQYVKTQAITNEQKAQAEVQKYINTFKEKGLALTESDQSKLADIIKSRLDEVDTQKELADIQARYNSLLSGTKTQEDKIKETSDWLVANAELLKITQEDIDKIISSITPKVKDWSTQYSSIERQLQTHTTLAGKVEERYRSIKEELDKMKEAGQDVSALEELLKVKIQFDLDKASFQETQKSIDNISNGLSSLRSMTEEGSRGYKELTVLIEAMNLASAVHAVLNQAAGDPYTAFARMAAMASAVASLGYAVGSLNGSSGGQTLQQVQSAQGTGTVLGDVTAQSESIIESTEMTAEATSALVGINTKMLQALNNLGVSLSDTATLIARSISSPTVGTSTSSNALQTLSGIAGAAVFSMGISTPMLIATGLIGFKLGEMIGDWLEGTFIADVVNSIANTIESIPLIGGIASSLFGSSSTKLKDFGIRLGNFTFDEMLNGLGTWFYTMTKTSSSSMFGLSSSSSTNTSLATLPIEVNRQISLVFQSMADSILAATEVLGFIPQEVEKQMLAFEVEVRNISLKDLSVDEQAAQIEAVFSSIFDELASFVLDGYLDEFQQAGEGMAETLIRVANNVLFVGASLGRVGINLEDLVKNTEEYRMELWWESIGYGDALGYLNKRIIEISTQLVEAAGGYEEFAEIQNSFIENFYSETEQFEVLQSDLTNALSNMGYALPSTSEGFRKLVESMDITTESGVQAYVTLLSLSSVAGTYYEQLEEQHQEYIDNIKAQYDEAISATDEALQALRTAIDAEIKPLDEALSSLQNVASSLTSTIDSLRISSVQYDKVARASAQATIQRALDMARQGILPQEGQLDTALSVLTSPSEQMFGTYEDYAADFWKTSYTLRELNSLTEDQISETQMMIDNLESIYDEAVASVNAIRGIDDSILSVQQAVTELNDAIIAELKLANTYAYATANNTTLVIANTKPLITPFEWNTSTDGVTGVIATSRTSEAIYPIDGSHAGGLDYVPYDGYVAELHKGERVLTAKESQAMQADNATLINEVRQLRTELVSVNKNQLKETRAMHNKQLEWDTNGLPQTRVS